LESRFWRHTHELLSKRSIPSVVVLLALSALLVLLAVLQYRWSGKVSETERERMQKNLDTASRQFQEAFYREVLHVCETFQLDRVDYAEEDKAQFVERYKYWERIAEHPQIVAGLFIWKSGGSGSSQLLHLNQTSEQFEPAGWPQEFQGLRGRLAASEGIGARGFGAPGPVPLAWMMVGEIPALIHPLMQLSPSEDNPRGFEPRRWGEIILELNSEYIQREYLPELSRRFFGDPEDSPNQVRIVSGSRPPKVIYPPNFNGVGKDLLAGAILVDLLEPRAERPSRSWLAERPDDRDRGRRERTRPRERGLDVGDIFVRHEGRPRPALLLPGGPEESWLLVVENRSGSLESVVAASRRRNLAISFGILLLLAVSAVMAFVSTMRARRLARLQMEFVAGVSHELRTPLAVICSAADNLATGIVGGKEQIQHYGALIRNAGSLLTRMVQQILLFASSQAGRVHYELRPVQIAEVIDSVLADSRHLIETAGFSMERQIEPDLPLVLADPDALGHCLQNLISNAVKYGGDHRWMGIRVRKSHGISGAEVQVIIEDKGLGIKPEELDGIFEPFYRSKSVTTAQIHGTGLGLTLAKSIAEAMGGNLDVESTPGKGSAFTLHLPVLMQVEQQHRVKVE
jgi:signal transduction histidine kinase